jgi:hypothetical protein
MVRVPVNPAPDAARPYPEAPYDGLRRMPRMIIFEDV